MERLWQRDAKYKDRDTGRSLTCPDQSEERDGEEAGISGPEIR